MLEYLALMDVVEKPELKPWEKRTMLGVLEHLRESGYMTPAEAASLNEVRERVFRSLNGDGEGQH